MQLQDMSDPTPAQLTGDPASRRTTVYADLERAFQAEKAKLAKAVMEGNAMLEQVTPGHADAPPEPKSKAEMAIRLSYVKTMQARLLVAKVLNGEEVALGADCISEVARGTIYPRDLCPYMYDHVIKSARSLVLQPS